MFNKQLDDAKILQTIIFILLLTFAFSCFGQISLIENKFRRGIKTDRPGRNNHVAFAWTANKTGLKNIIPFHGISHDTTAKQMKEWTYKMPEGLKVLFSWDLHRGLLDWQIRKLEKKGIKIDKNQKYGLNTHPGDSPIVWDNGARVVQERFDKLFKEYKKIDGKVDYFILDFEGGMSNWHLSKEGFKRISDNPGAAKVAKTLGFDDLAKIYNWNHGDDYLRWNAAMQLRVATYVN
jgi:hypothetical protein